MDSPTIVLIAVLLLFVLLERFRHPAPDPIAALLQPPPHVAVDHTSELISLVRDSLATLEKIANPPQTLQPEHPNATTRVSNFDMDLLDPTDTTPWLYAGGAPVESTVNVAPEPATHPMGIPGLQLPEGMQFTYTDDKARVPFDLFRVDV